MITDQLKDIWERAGIPHFDFHDLRHYCASVQHALGVPDAYIMQRGGWGNDRVLKEVYRHALKIKYPKWMIKPITILNLCNTKCNTNKKSAYNKALLGCG